MNRVLGFILGVLMCIGGIYCLANPAITFSTITIVLAITMIESAVAYFILWIKVKQSKESYPMLLVNAILSGIAGVILLTNIFTQVFVQNVILYMIAFIMLFIGISTVVNAFKIKKIAPKSKWGLILVLGILNIAAGILSFINPTALAITLGIQMAINIFATGLNLIISSFVYKEIEDKIEDGVKKRIAKKA